MTEPMPPEVDPPPDQIQSVPNETEPDQGYPPNFREQLVLDTIKAAQQPDMAEQTYALLGIQAPVKLAGFRDSVARLKPGDLVGWHGGDAPDGTYVGQSAVYAGNREIIEPFYGTVRRRKLTDQDNVFGLPVTHPSDEAPYQPYQ